MAETYTTGHCAHNAPGGCQLLNLQCGYPECDRKAATPPPMPVDPLEQARERLEAIRLLLPDVTQLLDAAKQEWSQTGEWSGWDQSVRDRLGAWMMGAELDRRSPPTKGVDPGCGFIDCVNECGGDFTHATCPHVRALKRLTIAARTSGGTAGPDTELMVACAEAEAALAAAPPPPDVSRGLDREEVARIIALAGLGTTTGNERWIPPTDKWDPAEWHQRVLECVPGDVERRCYETADAIIALTTPPPTNKPE